MLGVTAWLGSIYRVDSDSGSTTQIGPMGFDKVDSLALDAVGAVAEDGRRLDVISAGIGKSYCAPTKNDSTGSRSSFIDGYQAMRSVP